VPAAEEYFKFGLGATIDHTAPGGGEVYETIIGLWPPLDGLGDNPVAASYIVFDLTAPGGPTEPSLSENNPRLILEIGSESHEFEGLPSTGLMNSSAHGLPDDATPPDLSFRSSKGQWTQVDKATYVGRLSHGGRIRYRHQLPGDHRVRAAVAFEILADLESLPDIWWTQTFSIGLSSSEGSQGQPQLAVRTNTISTEWMNPVYNGYHTNVDGDPAPSVDWGGWHKLVSQSDGPRLAEMGIWIPGDSFTTTFTPNVTPGPATLLHHLRVFSRGFLFIPPPPLTARSYVQVIG
jgi:hypothetical protein